MIDDRAGATIGFDLSAALRATPSEESRDQLQREYGVAPATCG